MGIAAFGIGQFFLSGLGEVHNGDDNWTVPAQISGSEVVIVATNSLWIKKDSAIIGDLVVNLPNEPREGETTAPPTLVPGVEAQVDANVMVTGSVQADSIGNEQETIVTGETLCNDIQGVGPLACENLPAPLLLPDLKLTGVP